MPEDRRSSDSSAAENGTRFGFVAVIGAPNAGKSTLVNRLVGTKVTIVSRKVQTTRMPIRGIAMIGDSQLVLVDTPGIFAPRRRLDRAMVEAAWTGAGDADLVVLLVDAAKGIDEELERLLDRLARTAPKARKVLALNKVDRLSGSERARLARRLPGSAPVSALTGEGVPGLLEAVDAVLPHPPVEVEVLVPWERGDLVAMLYERAEVLKAEAEPEGTRVHARVGLWELSRIRSYAVSRSPTGPGRPSDPR
jgi:GTP-binding protein Era